MFEDVLDDLEANLEAMPAVWANPINFAEPVRNKFAILDPIEGDIRSGVHGSVEDGDVEVFPMTDDAGARPPRHASFRSGQQQTWPIQSQ